jgi:hypothetical protein
VAEYSRRVSGGSGRDWVQTNDLRRALPFFSLAFAVVAAISQPSSAGDLALTVVPVVAWTAWALAPSVPLTLTGGARPLSRSSSTFPFQQRDARSR